MTRDAPAIGCYRPSVLIQHGSSSHRPVAHQWEKKTSVFSISMLGTLKAMTSYGSAANSKNWYFRSHASLRCSKALINRCRGRVPSSISGYSTCRHHDSFAIHDLP